MTKLKLPIQIKHGQIRKLDVRVPWLKITSCPVLIILEGVDLLLTPLASDQWEVPDIFSPAYLQSVLEKIITSALAEQTTEQQQSYLDNFRLKILDNLKVKITDIHVRIEHAPYQQKQQDVKQSSFGILLRSLELHTTDEQGKEVFHDRDSQKVSIFKLLSIDGLAVYLNPYDATMIHKLPFKAVSKSSHIATQMTKAISQYLELTSIKEGNQVVPDDQNLIYILRPLSLKVQVERRTKAPQVLNLQITLDQFNIQILYNQLKAILVFARLANLYQKMYSDQEKVKKYKFLRQTYMTAGQKWAFAIDCVCRSIKTKNGALTAFNIPNKKLIELEERFKPLLLQYYLLPEADRFKKMQDSWSEDDQKFFWYVMEAAQKSTIQLWVKEVILPINQIKIEKEKPATQQTTWMQWLTGTGQQSAEQDEDDLDQFFDCEEEPEEQLPDRATTMRESTSLSVVFEVKEHTILVAKLNSQNKLDGIQMYNKSANFSLTSPSLSLKRFQANVTFQEFGVDLVTIDRTTGKYVDCTATIKKNNQINAALAELQNSPQLTLEITKGDQSLAKQMIEYDINLQIISVIYKHFEDLVIRAKAISKIQIDDEISTYAKGSFEELRQTTQNRLHELLYKKRNRFVISIQSPVIILPVRGTYEENPVWVVRTGDMLILSEDSRKLNQQIAAQQASLSKLAKKSGKDAQPEEFEGYRLTITSIGLEYFHSFESYEKQLNRSNSRKTEFQQRALVQNKQNEAIVGPQFHEFTQQQNQHLNQRTATHGVAKFSVLEDFQIQIQIRLKKKKQLDQRQSNLPKLQVDIKTSAIKINLSLSIYNLLVNMSEIFKISKQKQEEFAKEIQDYQLLQKASIVQNAVIQGLVKIQNQDNFQWEEKYAILSGKYLYLFQEKSSQEYLTYYELDNIEVVQQGYQLTITFQDESIVVLRSTDGPQSNISWYKMLKKRGLEVGLESNSQQDIEKVIEMRKTRIKQKAEVQQDKNYEVIQLKFSCSVPQLKVQMLRLSLLPNTKVFIVPEVYFDWITFALTGMEIYRVSRELDSQLQIQFQQITLSDETLPYHFKTLLFQKQDSQNSEKGSAEPSLKIVINTQKKDSPIFEGLLEEIEIELTNMNLKFMPETMNQLIKFLRSTKPKRMHNEEFIKAEEFRLYHQGTDATEEIQNPNSQNIDQNLLQAEADESKGKEDQQDQVEAPKAEKIYETTCNVNKVQTSQITFRVKTVQATLVHHQYAMELYSLDTTNLNVKMKDWYDHSSFEITMNDLTLCDLTGYPYTRSPKVFFDQIQKNIQPENITPNELIKCSMFEMCFQSFQSPKCPLKKPKFASQLTMRISPFRINYVQEVTMRLIEYFQERFLDALVLSDPYKNPKLEFEKRKNRKNIPLEKINNQTDFQQPKEITCMDITIQKAEIYAKDRPFSQSFILISSPTIKVNSEQIYKTGRIILKPEIQLAVLRYKIELQTINFWYGTSKKRKDRLSLLKETFGVKIDFENVAYSEFIEKIDVKHMDKGAQIRIQIDPMLLVLPQSVYTYILRCTDLNFAWSDQMQAEFYCIKWKHISEHYKQLKKVVSQRQQIQIPMLSLTLKHTDGSYISELLLSRFDFQMVKFMDGASEMQVRCSSFYILDQKDLNQDTKQAIVCPAYSPMHVSLLSVMHEDSAQTSRGEQDYQLQVDLWMKPTGRRKIIVTIQGLKIFVKLPLFILVQNYFLQAFPEYKLDDKDKPVGFLGNDPDNTSQMQLKVHIYKSLICLLNRPGYKSIAFQGDIIFQTKSENINKVKEIYDKLGIINQQSSESKRSFISDTRPSSEMVYSMELAIKELTPYICSLTHLESGNVDINSINKRQLHNPLELSFEQNYYLTAETNQDQEETGKWGVTVKSIIKIGKLMLKLSILDLHLILQATAYMSEQIAEETVSRLKHIEQSIDRDFIENQQQSDLLNTGDDAPPFVEGKETFFINKNSRPTLQRKEQLTAEQKLNLEQHKQELFEGLLNKFRESNQDSISTVMSRLSQTTGQFQKLTKGYTSKKYGERGSFLQFIKKDILMEEDDDVIQDEGPLQKIMENPVGIEEASSDSEESKHESQQNLRKTQDDFNSEQRQKSVTSINDSYKQKSSITPTSHSSGLHRPTSAKNSKVFNFKQSGKSSSQVSKLGRNTPSQKSAYGRQTPNSYRSAQSDNEDDFKSARDSFESYRDQVEEALDVFYSFHEKRTQIKIDKADDMIELDSSKELVESVPIFGAEYIRDTEADMRNSGSFTDSLINNIKLSKRTDNNVEIPLPTDINKKQSSLQNVLTDVKDMYVEHISILGINDFNSGFTPVLQFELSNLKMNQNWESKGETDTVLVLPFIKINYYNLELGEWEPFLEQTQATIDQHTTKEESYTDITFKDAIALNATEQCLKNIFHTYRSWMQTPQYFQKPKTKDDVNDEGRDTRLQTSLNDEYDEQNYNDNVKSKLIFNSIRESILEGKRPLEESKDTQKKKNREQIMAFTSEIDNQIEVEGYGIDYNGLQQKKSGNELVTPFSIVNYTTRTIKIVRGGIKPGQFSEVKLYSSQLPRDLTENEKIYVLSPRQETDYAVTYDRLMGIQRQSETGQDQPPDLEADSDQNDDTSEGRDSERGYDQRNQMNQEKLKKLQNKEVVGIQLSELDYVPFFDLNKNTGNNPWVHEISSYSNESVLNLVPEESKVPDLEAHLLSGADLALKQQEEEKFEDTWEQRKIRNRVFYGTLIKDMRKFLVVRAPYCIQNKSSLNFEIIITETQSKRIKSQFKVLRGEIIGLDQQFYKNHSLQIRVFQEGNHLSGQNSNDSRAWSSSVQISVLLQLSLESAGKYLTTFDGQSLCTCIKLEKGSLNGTTDIVLLPVITINNSLPTSLQIRPFQQKSAIKTSNVEEAPIKPLYTEIYIVEQSQEKQFHTFSPTRFKDNKQVLQIEILVTGFDWKPIDLQITNEAIGEERDFEISDLNGSTVKIGLRIQYQKAGFHLVLFAHACVLVETVLALPIMQIYYKGGNFQQRKPLANSDDIFIRKFVLCNKDSDIVVGIKDTIGQGRSTYSFSPTLDIKAAGKLINFKVVTQAGPEDDAFDSRYDLVCTPTLVLANYQESIYTKLVLISPRYVLVNKTKGHLRIAQHNTINLTPEHEQIFEPGEKREWFWPMGDIQDNQLKIVIQKTQARGFVHPKDKKSQNQADIEQFGNTGARERRVSESDRVLNWNWSEPISISQEDNQMLFPILISEENGIRKKIFIVGKKLVGSTNFITIRDEKPTDKPTYLIKNSCPNLRIGFSQDGMNNKVVWHLDEKQQSSYAHLDPQALVKTITFHLTIDKDTKRGKFRQESCMDRVIERIDLESEQYQVIEYTDYYMQNKQIEMTLSNDGQTKMLHFQPIGFKNQSQVEIANDKAASQLVKVEAKSELLKSSMVLKINNVYLSVIGYTKQNFFDQIEGNYKKLLERNEIALLSIQGLVFQQIDDYKSSLQTQSLVIDQFQIDNQQSQNPLFQTIFTKKNNSVNAAKFLILELKKQINTDKNTNYIENFKADVAYCTFKVDDEFLINFNDALIAYSQTDSNSQTGVHPLFMKDNFFDNQDLMDLYRSTAQMDSEELKSQNAYRDQTFLTAQTTEQKNRNRATIRQNLQFGVFTTQEFKCPQQITAIPMNFRHWVMQEQIVEDSSKLYLKRFEISKIQLDLSFIVKTKKKKNETLSGTMTYLTNAGLTVVNLDEAQFQLGAYLVEKHYLGQQDFFENLNTHYSQQAISLVRQLPFQLGIIGSPQQLFRQVGDGIFDLVELPRRGFQTSWQSGLSGVALGSLSFTKNLGIGLFQSVQTLSSNLSTMALILVHDKDYSMEREESHLTEKPLNFVEGVGYGAKTALYSVWNATTSFVYRPYVLSQRNGYLGFFDGLRQGILGVFFKPIAGGLDFISKSSEGVKNTFRLFEFKQKTGRIRQPRPLYGLQRLIKEFSEDDAFMISNVLCMVKAGQFQNDHFVDMRLIRTANENRTPHFLLWSEENLFLIEATQKALVWHIECKSIKDIQNLNNGLMIHLDKEQDYAGRAQVGLPLDTQHQVEINQWIRQIKKDF